MIINTGGFVRRAFDVRVLLWALHPKVETYKVIFCYRKINRKLPDSCLWVIIQLKMRLGKAWERLFHSLIDMAKYSILRIYLEPNRLYQKNK